MNKNCILHDKASWLGRSAHSQTTWQEGPDVQNYGTSGGTFLFQYLSTKKLKQKELKKKSKQYYLV